MTATKNENLNPFVKGDKVKVNYPTSFLNGKVGTVVHIFDVSTEVKLDDKMTIITAFTNLTKRKNK